MIGTDTLIIFGITGTISIVFYWWTQIYKPRSGENRTPLYLFTKRNQVYRIEAENSGGILFPDKIGSPGYVERQTASITRRSGRLWKFSNSTAQNDANRSRERIYVTRENDPTPLTISLGAECFYQGPQIDNAEFKALSNLNQREAAANARMEGSFEDSIANKLLIATIIAVAGAVLAWGGVYALVVKYGVPVL